MSRPLQLEDFGSGAFGYTPSVAAPPAGANTSAGPTDDTDLAAYENGYKSGWDDCAAAEAEGQRRIGADLAANLSDLSFTYAEARRDVLQSLGPLFEEMAAQLLPTLAAEAVSPVVLSELQRVAETSTENEATLFASPVSIPVLQRLIDSQPEIAVTLEAEPAYAEGQVSIRYQGRQRDIDLSEAAERMAQALRGFVSDAIGQIPTDLTQGAA